MLSDDDQRMANVVATRGVTRRTTTATPSTELAASDLARAAGPPSRPSGPPPVHLTRRRTNSIIRRPKHLDSDSASPPPPGPSSSSSLATATPPSSAPSPPPVTSASSSSQIRKLSLSLASSNHPADSPQPPPPPLHHHSSSSAPSKPVKLASAAAASDIPPHAEDKRHPRELVPKDVGFPTPLMRTRIHKEDLDDPLLMAVCAVLLASDNRALCPKEIAEVMEDRNWLHNAGTTPFAHISTCVRAHLKRCQTGNYPPLVTSFELVGALTPYEVRAVGLRAEDKPAVKRGTLWYLSEKVLGRDCGVEDPFNRCRREAGLSPSEKDGVYVRAIPVPPPHVVPPHHSAIDDDEDDNGMGRGKRKRRASSAMMASFGVDPTPGPLTALLSSSLPASTSSPANLLSKSWSASATSNLPQPHHRRSSSFGGPSSSASGKSGVPRLRLRLTSLEEVESMDDSDGATSDAVARRKTKKKARRAASEGGVGMSREGSANSQAMDLDDDDDDDDDDVDMHHGLHRPTFSSASSSALLAQSLLAASTSAPSQPNRLTPLSSPGGVISPDSLHYSASPFHPRLPTNPHHLSISAPIFSSFPSAASPDASMDVDSQDYARKDVDSADEEDFHEAMLRGDDFDFEWGSETYAGSAPTLFSAKAKGKTREPELDLLPDPFDMDDANGDLDAQSTPATTPRSPQRTGDEDDAALEEETDAVRKEETPAHVAAAAAAAASGPFKMGMEATLCGEFAHESEDVAVKKEDATSIDRATSNDSLSSLVDEEEEEQKVSAISPPHVESDEVPLPSPLSLELPSLLPISHVFSPDYDFVGYDEEDERYQYRTSSYDRERAESADDEDEDDGIVNVKIEDEGSVGPESNSGPSSRQSSVFPIDSFSRRLTAEHISSPASSSGSSDSDNFDPSHMIVSNSLLATGMPVPQVAPSPPETTDWGMHLDLDDLDLDLGSSVDLLGPESVGLEELDLAWGGAGEQGDFETDEEFRARAAEGRAKARALGVGHTAFVTGDFSSLVTSRSRVSSSAPAETVKAPSIARALSTVEPPIVVQPLTPIHPRVYATVLQQGAPLPVYVTTVVHCREGIRTSLLRRIDSDYVNGSIFLQAVISDERERDEVLSEFSETFKVTSIGDGLPGTWIPLPSARKLSSRYPALSQFNTFLEDDLGSRFPVPIPGLRNNFRDAPEAFPTVFGIHALETASTPATPPTSKATTKASRRTSSSASSKSSTPNFHVAVPSVKEGVRKSRRTTITK